MTDETTEMTDSVVATLDAAVDPAAKLAEDRALFDKLSEKEEFSTATETPKEEVEEEPEEAVVEEKAEDPRVVAARAGLEKAGFPKTSISGASDEEALSWWNRHTESDFDRSTAKEQALDLQRRLDKIETERQAPPEPETPPVELDPSAVLKAMTAQFGDEGGKEMSDALMAMLSPVLEDNKSLRDKLSGIEKNWADAEARQTKAMTDTNRQRLQAVNPLLENNIAWKAVEDAASQLLQSGANYLTADHLFDEAVESIYGDAALETVADKTSKQKKKIRSATPTTESRKRAPETLSPTEKRMASDWDSFNRTEKKRKAGEYR